MQFSKLSIAALSTLLATAAVAAPAPDSVVARSAEAVPGPAVDAAEALDKRGFGCPGDEKKCHNHVSASHSCHKLRENGEDNL